MKQGLHFRKWLRQWYHQGIGLEWFQLLCSNHYQYPQTWLGQGKGGTEALIDSICQYEWCKGVNTPTLANFKLPTDGLSGKRSAQWSCQFVKAGSSTPLPQTHLGKHNLRENQQTHYSTQLQDNSSTAFFQLSARMLTLKSSVEWRTISSL